MSANQQIGLSTMTESPRPAATELSFAHLSDPHLTHLRAARWPQLLNKRLLGYLSWRRRRQAEHRPEVLDALVRDLHRLSPDQIVITGDLTQIGLPDEFRQARDWLQRLGDSDRVTVIPGNHDAYVHADWGATYALWQAFMQSDPAYRASLQTAAVQFPTLRVRGRVAVIGLSSAVVTAPFLATGRLGAAQRERLAQLLRWSGEQGLFRLVLLHHPPRVQDEKWRKRLTDGDALCRILGREGAELVLHGHGHRGARSAIAHRDGDIPVFGIASASAIGQRHGRRAQYGLYRVHGGADNWTVSVSIRGYQLHSQTFEALEEIQFSRPVIASTRR